MLTSMKCAAVAALSLTVPLLAAGSAEARRGVKPYYTRRATRRAGPVRGYSRATSPPTTTAPTSASPIATCNDHRRRQAALPRHQLAPGADLPVSGAQTVTHLAKARRTNPRTPEGAHYRPTLPIRGTQQLSV